MQWWWCHQNCRCAMTKALRRQVRWSSSTWWKSKTGKLFPSEFFLVIQDYTIFLKPSPSEFFESYNKASSLNTISLIKIGLLTLSFVEKLSLCFYQSWTRQKVRQCLIDINAFLCWNLRLWVYTSCITTNSEDSQFTQKVKWYYGCTLFQSHLLLLLYQKPVSSIQVN